MDQVIYLAIHCSCALSHRLNTITLTFLFLTLALILTKDIFFEQIFQNYGTACWIS